MPTAPIPSAGGTEPSVGNQSAMTPYRPFPLAALPGVLREFVEAVGKWADADPAFAALPALTVAGAAVGLAVCASPKRKFDEPPLLWTCAVADSGTGKSPCLKPSADIAVAIDRRLRARFLTALDRFDADLGAWKDADPPDPATKPTKPKREYFFLIDTTIERLAENIGTSPRGVVVVRDELSGWFASFTRYSGKADGSDMPNWLSLFEAGPLRYHRKTGEPRDVESDRGFAAVCGGIQPAILKDVLSNPAFISSGLAARLVFAMPPKWCPGYTDDELDVEVEARFAAVLDFLRELPFDPKIGPAKVRLDGVALARFKSLSNEFATAAGNTDGGPMSAALPKASRLALRLALVWHCVEEAAAGRDPAKGTIGETAMAAGETLAQWFVGEAERVYAMLGEKPEDRSARLLADWIRAKKGGRVRPRGLQRKNARQYPTADAAERTLDGLVNAGFGRWVDEPSPVNGGHAGRVFVLDPSSPTDTRHSPTLDNDADTVVKDDPSDTRSEAELETPQFLAECERASASVGCRTGIGEPTLPPEAATLPPEQVSDAPPAEKVRRRANPNRGVGGNGGAR